VHVTAARFGKVDKVYIHTAQDQVVSPYLQQKMVAATPVRLQMTLNTGHTPFLTDVPGLVPISKRVPGKPLRPHREGGNVAALAGDHHDASKRRGLNLASIVQYGHAHYDDLGHA
jgi:hypothetical protein